LSHTIVSEQLTKVLNNSCTVKVVVEYMILRFRSLRVLQYGLRLLRC